ncbi:MAG TPA: glycerate kinase [Xanthobacteraceae bacterium]|jgi:hydroxypyruvate reductase|nr:glycerate kinase [Xanthobacteraceae bacterium]
MNWNETKALLNKIYEAAVTAAHPAHCLVPHLPPMPARGNVIIIAAGKAGGSMAEVAERHYLEAGLAPERLSGIAVSRHGYGRKLQKIEMVEAGHPMPDEAGIKGAEKILRIASAATENDLVLVLMSGGASANLIAPADGITLDDKRALTKQLLASGANIGEINTVRKHLSRIKGGRLALAAQRAKLVTFAISDVPGDDPSVIGSGPTVPDASTLSDARAILRRRQINLSAPIAAALDNPKNESPKPDNPVFRNSEFHIVARPVDSLTAAAKAARDAGLTPVVLGADIEGEARNIAAQHAEQAKKLQATGRRSVLLSGGELTVTMTGNGRGGPNQEYALALALALNGAAKISAVAGDTDGTDGGGGDASDPAGAFVSETTLARAKALGLDAAALLANNDSTAFFEKLGDLLKPGPTYTNVNDLRAVLIDT